MQDNAIKTVTDILTTGHVVTAIAFVVAVWVLLKIIEYFANGLSKRFIRYRIQITGTVPLLRIVIWTVAVYVLIVKVFNPPEATLLAMVASTGLAVGLAAQDVIRNIISGALILFEQPFRVGDMISIDGHYGEVLSIDDNTITVPNATVTGQSVSNANSGALEEMVVVSFVLPAHLDAKIIKDLAWEAADCSPYVYLRKPINVIVTDEFNRTFLNRYSIKAYVHDVRYERLFSSDVLERTKKALIDMGIVTEKMVVSVMQGAGPRQPSAEPSVSKVVS
jgi:small-conductance mechanosensitive channel